MSTKLSQNAVRDIEYPYPESIELMMKKVYDGLSEKEKRSYAAIEALKLPYGGKQYVCEVLECAAKTIDRGIRELNGEESTPG